MNSALTPAEIARETLKQLSEQKLPPTPTNYIKFYGDIAGTQKAWTFPEEQLRNISRQLTAHGAEQRQHLDHLDAGIAGHDWERVESSLVAFCRLNGTTGSHSGYVHEPSNTLAESESSHRNKVRLVRVLQTVQLALDPANDGLREMVASLKNSLEETVTVGPESQADLEALLARLPFVFDEQREVRGALLRLLHLVVSNVAKLLIEETWLDGQMSTIVQAIEPPLTLRNLEDAESRLSLVIATQAVAMERSHAAREEVRRLLGGFIERLASIKHASKQFQETIDGSARMLETAMSFEEMAPILGNLLAATRTMSEQSGRTQDELEGMRGRVVAAEAAIASLSRELTDASAMARHDPLTGVLNRKGLSEAMTREMAERRRKGTMLSVALLDIDNFKRVNDQYGHESGDAALVHLVSVVQTCLRPGDSVARYGGEEFVILLPETGLDESEQVLVRLQRELTKHFFLAGNEKLLITFSAGVTEILVEELAEDAIGRADRAMYMAKRSGKNRVAKL